MEALWEGMEARSFPMSLPDVKSVLNFRENRESLQNPCARAQPRWSSLCFLCNVLSLLPSPPCKRMFSRKGAFLPKLFLLSGGGPTPAPRHSQEEDGFKDHSYLTRQLPPSQIILQLFEDKHSFCFFPRESTTDLGNVCSWV